MIPRPELSSTVWCECGIHLAQRRTVGTNATELCPVCLGKESDNARKSWATRQRIYLESIGDRT